MFAVCFFFCRNFKHFKSMKAAMGEKNKRSFRFCTKTQPLMRLPAKNILRISDASIHRPTHAINAGACEQKGQYVKILSE